ncbi:ankyrin repeat and socs box protein [Anaeramoeba ignava]|uniref:Ankyrin repeat and socs box protein n=1 Tax=Anaeramoeba ignava TaxID=1746090 RepID=A0A9Q0R7V6_ANAIG|nr:ankyrin repeat and socs box protein [Anaeramoeba ignava]
MEEKKNKIGGWFKIHQLVKEGNLEELKEELKKPETNVNAQKADGWTPSHLAALNDRLDCLVELVRYGANLHIQDKIGKTPYSLALSQNNFCLKFILENMTLSETFEKIKSGEEIEMTKEELEERDQEGASILHMACIFGRYELIGKLIGKGIQVNDRDKHENTGIHHSCVYGYREIVSLLAGVGGEIDAINSKNMTPLLLSCRFGFADVVKLLIQKGADLKKTSKNLTNAIHYSCFNGNENCAQILLQTKTAVEMINSQRVDGKTPAHLAAQHGHLKSLQILCSFGADLSIEDKNSDTPFTLAALNKQKEIIKWILRTRESVYQSQSKQSLIHLFVNSNDFDMLKLLLSSSRFDVNVKDKDGNSPAHLACKNSAYESLVLLLKFGCDIHTKNNENKFPKDLCTDFKCSDLISKAENHKLFPSRVQQFECTSRKSTALTLVWSQPRSLEKISSYLIELKSENGPIISKLLKSKTHDITVRRLLPNTLYSFKIRAQNEFGMGEWSKKLLSCQTGSPTVPDTIVEIFLKSRNEDSLIITWTPPEDNGDQITEYEFEITNVSKGSSNIHKSNSSLPQFCFQNLNPDTEYLIRVRSKNAIGWSQWCMEESFRTKLPSKN